MSQHAIPRRQFIRTAALAVPALAVGRAAAQTNRPSTGTVPSDFVAVRDGRFELRGRPYFYIGSNLWYGCYLGDPASPEGQKRMTRELDRLRSLGVNNLRLLAGSEASPLVGAIPRGITRNPGDWDENLLKGLDFCLAEMARRDMHAVLFLSNYWQWSGGFAQYVRWITGEDIPDPDRPVMERGNWFGFMKFSARFYTLPAADELYRAYISHLLQRRNSINGRLYRDDPAIMTWELANEPRPGAEESKSAQVVPVFAKWVDSTARFIHNQDPNHLVCTGSEGIWGCLKSPDAFVQAHHSEAIDYVTVHMWLKNWGWLRVPKLGVEFESAADRAKAHVDQHNVLATDKLHKPLVLEEFGLPRDLESYDPNSATTARDEYYRRMFDQVADSCKAGRALQGANFWAWGGEGRAGAGKPDSATALIGDPFCEPQGLNSVFDTDTSTHAVIARANQKLASLVGRGSASQLPRS